MKSKTRTYLSLALLIVAILALITPIFYTMQYFKPVFDFLMSVSFPS